MQYMLLVYDDPAAWNVTEDEMPAIYAEYAAVAQDKATKHSAQLQGTETAKTVRVKNGDTLRASCCEPGDVSECPGCPE